jgi:hypothetical protein
MKIFLRNTLAGLIPLYPSDYDEKRKLKLGVDYEADLKLPRNVGFHRKFFALLNVGFENTSLQLPFDTYRKFLLIKAGYFKAFQTDVGVLYEAESISFSNKNQAEFKEIYSRVLDEVIKDVGCTKDEIERQLISFM